MEFSRPEYWSGWPLLSPGDLPNPGIETRSPSLQAYSLPAEPQRKCPHPKKKKESPGAHIKDDAVKVPNSLCQHIWKTQQWSQDGKGQFSLQSQRKAIPKNVQTTAQLHLTHTVGHD